MPRGLSRSLTAPQRRFASHSAGLRETLRGRIQQHYLKQGDSEEESGELARAELGWLEEAAKEQTGPWEERFKGMVDELVEQDKPLAYILGE